MPGLDASTLVAGTGTEERAPTLDLAQSSANGFNVVLTLRVRRLFKHEAQRNDSYVYGTVRESYESHR